MKHKAGIDKRQAAAKMRKQREKERMADMTKQISSAEKHKVAAYKVAHADKANQRKKSTTKWRTAAFSC